MAQTLTTQEAETLLGKRGQLVVTKDNRNTVRKWIVAQNFPAAFVAGLSIREIEIAYNKTNGDGLAAIQNKYDKYLEEGGGAVDVVEPVAPTPVVAPAPANVPQAVAQNATAVDLLRDLLLNGYKPGLDENAVRAIVQESIAGVAPRVIEVKHQDQQAIHIEGIVHPDFELALHILMKGGNVMLVGPAGCGKSHMSKQLAKALNVDYGVICGSAGATEGQLMGRLLPRNGGNFEYCPSRFIQLYERGSALWCFDEIDGFDGNMLMCANVPLANGACYVQERFENPEVLRGPNFYFMATANTYGTGANPIYAGRNQLDEATRDRFIFITCDYDKRLEESISAAGGLTEAEMAGIWELRDRCREAQLRRVISTRAFQKASILKQCGQSWREIRDRLLEGWSKDEKAKVGV